MQSLVIFVVSRANNPQLIAEVSIAETFLPENVRRSNRFIYFEFVSAACTFLMDQAEALKAFGDQCETTHIQSGFFELMNQSIVDFSGEATV